MLKLTKLHMELLRKYKRGLFTPLLATDEELKAMKEIFDDAQSYLDANNGLNALDFDNDVILWWVKRNGIKI